MKILFEAPLELDKDAPSTNVLVSIAEQEDDSVWKAGFKFGFDTSWTVVHGKDPFQLYALLLQAIRARAEQDGAAPTSKGVPLRLSIPRAVPAHLGLELVDKIEAKVMDMYHAELKQV